MLTPLEIALFDISKDPPFEYDFLFFSRGLISVLSLYLFNLFFGSSEIKVFKLFVFLKLILSWSNVKFGDAKFTPVEVLVVTSLIFGRMTFSLSLYMIE